MAFSLSSPAFENGRPIPHRHTRGGDNLSPFLQWADPPDGAQSFVVVLEDADAPIPAFRHWVVYDIPRDRRHLAEGNSSGAGTEALPHATNDFGNARYDGPEPVAEGRPHTYRYRLMALNVPSIDVRSGAPARAVLEAARPHLIAEAELTGTYSH
ncbi:MAG: PEBP family protein [Alphaproteobacteria bacterium]|nr:MAG: PEBP family protein [Alphaproteobacteria bacterium]